MNETIVNPKIIQSGLAHLARYALYSLILLPFVAAILAYSIWTTVPPTAAPVEKPAEPTLISAKTLEERFGLRITRIAVTAAGGIIDVRYQVLDREKAEFLLGDPDNPLFLIVEESGTTLQPSGHAMKHNSRIQDNANYYSFFPNTQNAIKSGTPVTVVFGSLRVEPVVAQ